MRIKVPPVEKDKDYVKCDSCGKILISLHKHDFAVCPCWANDPNTVGLAIDGGDTYTRIAWGASNPPEIRRGRFRINYKTGKYKLLEELPRYPSVENK